MKFLFFSPVGESSAALLPAVVERMIAAGGDVALGVYDDWLPELPGVDPCKVRILWEPERRKWQIARKHFTPESMEAYDFIFLWDDDLAISDFDPALFLEIMRQNDLEVAQPSLLSPHSIMHGVTRQRACGKVLETGRKTVGRFTNFVEIMAPVYSREAWVKMFPYLDDENPEAFGYDFMPQGRRGIVDCMHVIHTRPTRHKDGTAGVHQAEFQRKHGFKSYPIVEMGSLTLAPPSRTNRRARA